MVRSNVVEMGPTQSGHDVAFCFKELQVRYYMLTTFSFCLLSGFGADDDSFLRQSLFSNFIHHAAASLSYRTITKLTRDG